LEEIVRLSMFISIAVFLGFTLFSMAMGAEPIKPNVKEYVSLGASWLCPSASSCTKGYEKFIKKAAERGKKLTQEQLKAQFQPPFPAPVASPFNATELSKAVRKALNVEFLYENIDSTLLKVAVIREEKKPGYEEKEYLFEDPWIGLFKVIRQRPLGPGPYPAVIVRHGHGREIDATVYRDNRQTKRFPENGIEIWIVTSRVMGADPVEIEMTRKFLAAGFTFLGIRGYETLLVKKYLRHLQEVDADRVGLIGHSGGSVALNVLVRSHPRQFKAYVSDNKSAYICKWSDPTFDDATPALAPLAGLINDPSTAPLPTLEVPYDYEDGPIYKNGSFLANGQPDAWAVILKFFRDQLK
jgi:hypothetical protein